jgi:hypothetical protein
LSISVSQHPKGRRKYLGDISKRFIVLNVFLSGKRTIAIRRFLSLTPWKLSSHCAESLTETNRKQVYVMFIVQALKRANSQRVEILLSTTFGSAAEQHHRSELELRRNAKLPSGVSLSHEITARKN